jgi:NADPH-dependent 2,4-dienoyl-CoA reductase/sulfur reductase-like enzyme
VLRFLWFLPEAVQRDSGFAFFSRMSRFLRAALVGGVLALGPAYGLTRNLLTPIKDDFKDGERKNDQKNGEKNDFREKNDSKSDKIKRLELTAPSNPHAQYIVIGGGTASYSAVMELSKLDPEASILIISNQNFLPYERPPLSKELWGSNDLTFTNWQGKKQSIFYPGSFNRVNLDTLDVEISKPACHFLGNVSVDKIDTEGKFITINGKNVGFSKLLIATGGTPKTLPLEGYDDTKVTTFRGIEDFQSLFKVASTANSIAVIGGGFLGSELATSLATNNKNLKVTQIFPEKGNMSLILPSYLSKWTTSQVKKTGVDVKSSSLVVGLDSRGEKVEIAVKNDDLHETIIVDHVVVAVGLEPNTGIAKNSLLEVDSVRGGILVNAELEARSDIFAAGDVVSYHDIALGRRRVEHYDHAVESGKLAARNMFGKKVALIHSGTIHTPVNVLEQPRTRNQLRSCRFDRFIIKNHKYMGQEGRTGPRGASKGSSVLPR